MSNQFMKAALAAAIAWFSPQAAQALDTIATFDPGLGEVPESVTVDADGSLYFTVGSTIRRRAPDGQISVFGTLPIAAFALGVKVAPNGCVYTASTSLSATPGAFLWRVCAAGQVEQVAALDPSGGPNDLAFDDEGRAFVTDPFLGRIWQVGKDGVPRIWLAHELLQGNPAAPALLFHALGADGIAFDRHQRNLVVSNVDFGRILRIPVSSRGEPGCPEIVAESPLLVGADGIAFDRQGTLLVAVNSQDSLVSVGPHGDVTTLAQGGPLDGPSSVVFAPTGHDAHRTFYVTSSAFSRVFQLQPGTPHPALLRGEWAHRGLTLP